MMSLYPKLIERRAGKIHRLKMGPSSNCLTRSTNPQSNHYIMNQRDASGKALESD